MDTEEFLNYISQLESSAGKNTSHKTMTSGIHKGYTAYGNHGLMPLTVQEFSRRSTDPEIRSLSKIDPHNYNQILKDTPEYEKKIVRQMADYVLKRQQDPLKAAYSWNQGHNLNPNDITPELIQQNSYAQKFNKLIPQQQEPQEIPLEDQKFAALSKYLR